MSNAYGCGWPHSVIRLHVCGNPIRQNQKGGNNHAQEDYQEYRHLARNRRGARRKRNLAHLSKGAIGAAVKNQLLIIAGDVEIVADYIATEALAGITIDHVEAAINALFPDRSSNPKPRKEPHEFN